MRFWFNKDDSTSYPDGSVVYRTHGPFSTVARVANCLCEDGKRRTVYATGYGDTFFSIPAEVRVTGRWVSGFLTSDDGGWRFTANAYGKNAALLKKGS